MEPYYQDEAVTIYHGEALAVLRGLPTASVDAVIADPPYSSGGAMRSDRMTAPGKKYADNAANRDQRAYGYWSALWLAECLRVTRRGAVLRHRCEAVLARGHAASTATRQLDAEYPVPR